MYNIEIKKLNYSSQLFVDGEVWTRISETRKEPIIKHAVYNLDLEWNFPPDLVDPIIEQGIKDNSFGMRILMSAGKVSEPLDQVPSKSINFKIY